jgi:uncharacterized protein YegP (UPF0339 family)
MLTISTYKDRKGEYRWRAKARNGKIVADSGEGYATHANARRAAIRFVSLFIAGSVKVEFEKVRRG